MNFERNDGLKNRLRTYPFVFPKLVAVLSMAVVEQDRSFVVTAGHIEAQSFSLHANILMPCERKLLKYRKIM